MALRPMDRVTRGLNQVFANYKYDCSRRNKFWGVSYEEFICLVVLPCVYCRAPPANKSWGLRYSGLDRKDNARGYTLLNVVPCCAPCNSIKGQHLTHAEMLAAMKTVLKLRQK